MKKVVGAVAVSASILLAGCAASTGDEPGPTAAEQRVNDTNYLRFIKTNAQRVHSTTEANVLVEGGHRVCEMFEDGSSGRDVAIAMMKGDVIEPAPLGPDAATAVFAAVTYFCPQFMETARKIN